MRHDVFVSYSRDDEGVAARIVDFLQHQGIRCWIDSRGLRFTHRYDEEIERAIRVSSVVVWLASRASLCSDYVKFEISAALNRRKVIGPVYLDPMDPARLPAPFNIKLAGVQGIEFFRGPEEQNLTRLAEGIRPLILSSRRRRWGVAAAVVLALAAVGTLCTWLTVTRKPKPRAVTPGSGQPVGRASDASATGPGRVLPPGVAALPASDVLEIAYAGFPPVAGPRAARPQLRLEIVARRSGAAAFAPLEDGAMLASEIDDYLILAQGLSPGYLYVFQVDSAGQKSWLFPRNESCAYSSGSNPVAAGQTIQVPSPESHHALYLDARTGIEHVYAVFSATRWPGLEAALARGQRVSAGPPGTDVGGEERAPTVQTPNDLRLRGVGGVVPIERTTGDPATLSIRLGGTGETQKVAVHGKALEASGSFLVVERWFHHVDPR